MNVSLTDAIPIVAFTDLDDTLFSSLHKHVENENSLLPVAYLKNGSPISYTDARQRALLRLIEGCSYIVPVTARSLSAFRRVGLSFSSYAVVSHGATIHTPDGCVEARWTEMVSTQLVQARPLMLSILDLLSSSAINFDRQLHTQLVVDEGREVYVVAKHMGRNVSVIDRLADEVARPWIQVHSDFQLHTNGNNLAILPPGIGKKHAAEYVKQRLYEELGEYMSIGIGDSVTDMHFMLDCDFALMPTKSQLAKYIEKKRI